MTVEVTQSKPVRVSLSGVCAQALIDAGTPLNLKQLHDACTKAGLQVTEAQVYAGIQSMASTGKCDRGPEKRTWVAKGAGRPAGVRHVPQPGEAPAKKTPRGLVSAEQTIRELTDRFGAPVDKPKRRKSYMVVLPTNFTTDELVERASKRLEQTPNSWFMVANEAEVLIGFPKTADIAVNQESTTGEALTEEAPF